MIYLFILFQRATNAPMPYPEASHSLMQREDLDGGIENKVLVAVCWHSLRESPDAFQPDEVLTPPRHPRFANFMLLAIQTCLRLLTPSHGPSDVG